MPDPTHADSAPTNADGPARAAKPTANCYVCGEGIYQCGHDDENKPYWLHVDGPSPGVRECERFPGAYATPF